MHSQMEEENHSRKDHPLKPERIRSQAFALVMVVSLAVSAFGQEVDIDPGEVTRGKRESSPYLDSKYPDRVFFGDTHLHTALSTDAGMVGCLLGPDDAYRFARGEEVTAGSGVGQDFPRPYLLVVVADHAEN